MTYACDRKEITKLPKEIRSLSVLPLTTLVLNDNNLCTLPDEFAELTSLEHLSLEVNRFVDFPSPILSLTKLESLQLSHNKLKLIPKEIAGLKRLTELILFANDLRRLPEEITKLERLVHLDVQCNFLRVLPQGLLSRSNLQLDADPEAMNQVLVTKKPAVGKKRPVSSSEDGKGKKNVGRK